MAGMHTDAELKLVVQARTELVPGIVELTLVDPSGGALPLWHARCAHRRRTRRRHRPAVLALRRPDRPLDLPHRRAARGRGPWRLGARARGAARRRGRGRARPRNHFAFEIAPSYRFIAGGIGITAILPMVRAAAAGGARWSLAYAGRSVEGMAYARDLAQAYPEQVRLFPSASTGRMDVAAELAGPDPVTDVYCCGPQGLMDAVEAAAKEAGWQPGALRQERFVPRELGAPVWQEAFEVDLLLSGQVVTVEPGQSILEAARGIGALVLSSCETGTCGTCETPVLEGAIEHRDSVLTADEQAAGDRMMICVSRAPARGSPSSSDPALAQV